MKRFLLLLLLLTGAARLMAREIVDGYYLTLKNDTVRCKIEPRDLDVFYKVTIIDSTGKYITYKAKDPNGINGFTGKGEPFGRIIALFDKEVSHLADLPAFVRKANSIVGS